jgi:hypothetical protein
MRTPRIDWTLGLSLLIAGVLAGPALAVDGVIEINQAKVKAGGVTASDAPLFPVTIDHPGSYRLTSDLDVTDATARAGGTSAENQTAIKVTADYVSIDLNGFSIVGPAVCSGFPPALSCTSTGGGAGISDNASGVTHLSVSNGTVRGMGFSGIDSLVGKDARVERVHAASNGAAGIVLGSGATVVGCTSSHNGAGGILAGEASSVRDNVVYGNKLTGIFVGQQCLVAGNMSASNGGPGLELGPLTGYRDNALSLNVGVAVTGGVNLGQNACNGSLCP